MEWLEIFYKISLIALVAIALISILFALHSIITFFKVQKCLKDRRDPLLLYHVAQNGFRGFICAHSTVIPRHPGKKDGGYLRCELIIVTHGGVHVLSSMRRGGKIQTPRDEAWSRTLKNGEVETFSNPMVHGAEVVHAVQHILRAEHISNVPVCHLLVTTASRVSFSEEYEGAVSADRLVEAVKNLDKNRFLTSSEQKRCCKAILKHLLSKGDSDRIRG